MIVGMGRTKDFCQHCKRFELKTSVFKRKTVCAPCKILILIEEDQKFKERDREYATMLRLQKGLK